MAFFHTRVDEIETHTAQFMAKVNRNGTHAPASHERNVGGLIVSAKLGLLCEEVSKIDASFKFGVTQQCKMMHRQTVTPMECWVYIPGDEFALMRIGYADYNIGESSKETYSVYARTIRNEKYGTYRDQYHMMLSENLERTVRNVKKYLRPYHTHDIAEMSASDVESKMTEVVYSQDSKFSEARGSVVGDPSFINEMRALVDNKYEFLDSKFGKKVERYLEEYAELKAKRNAQVHGHFVLVRSRGGRQVFDVIRVTDMRDKARKLFQSKVAPPVHTYTQENLPQDIAQKIAALSMLKEDDAFVEGLGYKVSATAYWVVD